MTEPAANKRPHFILHGTAKNEPFTIPKTGGGDSPELPERDRRLHGQMLSTQLQQVRAIAAQARDYQRTAALQSGIGIQVEFVGQPDVALAFESLSYERNSDRSKNIEVLSLHVSEENITSANVFIPDGKITHFENYLNAYLEDRRSGGGTSLAHTPLINTLSAIRLSSIRSLWTDDGDLLPADPEEGFWWEVWLPVRSNRDAVLADFRTILSATECIASEHAVTFPERTVTWMFGSQREFSHSGLLLNCVAELRRAKETAEFFTHESYTEQGLWAEDVLARLCVPDEGGTPPYICLLDSGLNRAHPLISPFVRQADVHTVNEAWGTDDRVSHGTGLAGLALYGDMFDAIISQGGIDISHRLESVKLISEPGEQNGDAHDHAYLFSMAVTRPEILFGERKRVFSSAVTATDYRDFGKPSAWSAMVDSLASDTGSEPAFPRLFVLSAGNILNRNHWQTYPASLSVNQIHDPAQAWNALTVGASTCKSALEEPGFSVLAGEGGLSPFTSTSSGWDSVWPLKPDIVFEGGNAGTDGTMSDNFGSLELLTANARFQRNLFTTTNATSAASALAARMAARLMTQFPDLRPETIRGLMTHSARWTPKMLEMYPANTQSGYANLIRHCGWGIPDQNLAVWSINNSLSLIEESSLRPYRKTSAGIKTNEMNVHALPWPAEELLALRDTPVEMRVTLSYFIEPNPSARGAASKFYYPSHRLRFAMKRPTEQTDDFRARINAAARVAGEETTVSGNDKNWLLGKTQRHKGSLHQDIWQGTAAELANCGCLAVYPGQGWWRSRQALEKYDSDAKYSLIVSIHVPGTEVDLLTPVQTQIDALIANRITVLT